MLLYNVYSICLLEYSMCPINVTINNSLLADPIVTWPRK